MKWAYLFLFLLFGCGHIEVPKHKISIPMSESVSKSEIVIEAGKKDECTNVYIIPQFRSYFTGEAWQIKQK